MCKELMRKEIVSGKFYYSDKERLMRQIEELTFDDFEESKIENAKGIIVPHAGYEYSGKAAVKVYSKVNLTGKSIVLLGPNHSGTGIKASVSFEDFSTPLGAIENDIELAREIVEADIVEHDEPAHKDEHSIEVQLPFIKYFNKEIRIVPILVNCYDAEKCKEIAIAIDKAAYNLKREIFAVASSDFTHYGRNYGFVPFLSEIKNGVYEIDKKSIGLIGDMDTASFLDNSRKTTICGAGAIGTAIELCKRLGAKKGRLIDYYCSGDVSGDYTNCVGYAGIVFE